MTSRVSSAPCTCHQSAVRAFDEYPGPGVSAETRRLPSPRTLTGERAEPDPAVHPGEPVMTYEEFFRERQASRYGENGGKVSRCC